VTPRSATRPVAERQVPRHTGVTAPSTAR
jgi:hypothetical protein